MEFKIVKKGYDPSQVELYAQEIKKVYEDALKNQKDRIFELKNSLEKAESEIKKYQENAGLISKAILNAVSKADEIEKFSKLQYEKEIEQLSAFHERWTMYYDKILDKYPLDEQLAAATKFNAQMSKVLDMASNGENSSQIFEDKSLENTFSAESERLNANAKDAQQKETQIGYIRVNTEGLEVKDGAISDIIPGADPNSPIMSGNFDPLERLNRYFASIKKQETEQVNNNSSEQKKENIEDLKNSEHKNETASEENYSDRAPSGFSLEECLNPKEDLSQIMKDLGLLTNE